MTQSSQGSYKGSSTSEKLLSGEASVRATDQECATCNDAGVRMQDFDAAIFDLDGVVTRTARVHAAAWKRLFDEYLHQRAARRESPSGRLISNVTTGRMSMASQDTMASQAFLRPAALLSREAIPPTLQSTRPSAGSATERTSSSTRSCKRRGLRSSIAPSRSSGGGATGTFERRWSRRAATRAR